MKLIKSFLKNLTLKFKIILIITCCSCLYLIMNAMVKLIRYPLTPDDRGHYILLACTSFLIMLNIYLQIRKHNRERLAMRMEICKKLKEIRILKNDIRRKLKQKRDIEAQRQELNE